MLKRGLMRTPQGCLLHLIISELGVLEQWVFFRMVLESKHAVSPFLLADGTPPVQEYAHKHLCECGLQLNHLPRMVAHVTHPLWEL